MVTYTYDGTRDTPDAVGSWTVTDWAEDLTLDCNTDDADLGDVLGTLIKQLIQKGILKGTVVAA